MKRMLLVALCMGALACSDSTSPTPASISGVWNLRTVNGSNLPYTVQSGTTRIDIIGDVLTVSEFGTFTQFTSYRYTQNGITSTQSLNDQGTYTLNGTAITFRFNSDGTIGTGSLDGRTLTVTAEGFATIYDKQ